MTLISKAAPVFGPAFSSSHQGQPPGGPLTDDLWPLYRHAGARPLAAFSAADLGFADLDISPFWRLDPPTAPSLDIAVADDSKFSRLVDFIIARRFDRIADYDAFYELQSLRNASEICDILVATPHRETRRIAGWLALKRRLTPSRYDVTINNVFVVPEFRGFAIGRALNKAALNLVAQDLAILAARQVRIAPTFHAECISPGGQRLAIGFATALEALLSDSSDTLSALTTIIE